MADKNAPLIPEEGWHCLHLFYRIDFAQWHLLSPEEQRAAKTALSELVQEIRATEKTQAAHTQRGYTESRRRIYADYARSACGEFF
jgi:hypothetical protein